MRSSHKAVVWLLLSFCVLVLAGTGAAAGANESVSLQDSSDVVIDEEVAAAEGEVQLVVELPAFAGSETTVAGLQQHAAESQANLEQFAAQTAGVQVENQFWLANAAVVRVDTDRVPVEALARVAGVERLGPNFEIRSLGQASDAGATAPQTTPGTSGVAASDGPTTEAVQTTYGLDQIDAPEVWNTYGTQGESVTVTVLDTGIDPDHPDINLTKWAKFDEDGSLNDSVEPQDYDPGGHGTHTSGTVAGGAASGTQIGVAPGVELHHGAVLTDCSDGDCVGTFSQIVAGMQWAVDNDADVLSMSLGANGTYSAFIDPVRNAESAGTTVVASSGNDGEGTSGSPGNVYDAISVGAADWNRDIRSFSSGEVIDTSAAWGSDAPAEWPSEYTVPTVAAPGAAVNSSLPGGGYGEKWGTSMAAPHVAGAAALAQAATAETVSPDEIGAALEATATKPDDWGEPDDQRDTRYGSGIIDVPATIEYLDEDLAAAFTVTPSTVAPGEQVTLNASNATGSIAEYRWDFDDDGTVETTTTDPVTTHAYSQTGQQTAVLTVVNDTGGTNQTSETVLVSEPPEAAFAATPTDPVAGTAVRLNASASTGTIVEYRWDFDGDGTVEATTTDPVRNHTYDQSGERTVVLTVVESDGQTNQTSRTVTVKAPLNASFDRSPLQPTRGEEVDFVASDSTGDIVEYRWDFDGDGTAETTTAQAATTHVYDEAGTQTVVLTVASGDGRTDTVSTNLTVQERLVAAFDATPDPPVAGETVTFDAENATGAIVEYRWDFDGDGTAETTTTDPVTTHVYDQSGEQTAVLTVANDTGGTNQTTATLTVEQPATAGLSALDIAGQGNNATITTEDNESVAVNVTNVGDQAGAFDVTLELGASVTQTQTTGTLGAGATETVTFENVTGGLSSGTYSVNASTAEATATGTLTVERPATPDLSALDIAGQESNATITTEDNASVAVNVTNVGDRAGAFDVTLEIGAAVTQTQTTGTLGAGATETVTFESVTSGLNDGTYSVNVTAAEATATGTLTVERPATPDLSALDIAGQESNATITIEDNESVAVNVTNIGDRAGAFDVTLELGTAVAETQTTSTLAGNATEVVTFRNVTGGLSSGTYSVNASTAEATATGTLTVERPATPELSALDIAGQESNATITTEDSASVAVNVTNIGDRAGAFDVTLELGTAVAETRTVGTLVSGATETVSFRNVTGGLSNGTYDVTVTTVNDSATGTLTVEQPPAAALSGLAVTGQGTDATITEGENASVGVNVTNVGDRAGSFEATLEIGTTVVETVTTGTLDGGATETVTVENVTGGLSDGTYDVTVTADADTVTGTLTVEQPATPDLSGLDVAGQGTAATITEGDDQSVGVTVTNVGDQAGAFDVTLELNTSVTDTQTSTLAAGATETVAFENVTGELSDGTYGVTVTSGSETATANLTVEVPLTAAVEAVSTALTVNQTATFNASNATGDIVEYRWNFDGDGTQTTDPATTHAFADPGTYTVGLTVVDSEGDTATANLTVSVSLPAIQDVPPQDPNDDGLYEDIRGDGTFDIFDVQTLFENLNAPAVQDHAQFYNFQGANPDRVRIFDVQAMVADL